MISSIRRILIVVVAILLLSGMAHAFRVTGKLLELQTKHPAGGMMVKGKLKGKIIAYTVSAKDGAFTLTVPDSIADKTIIEISGHGYEAQTLSVTDVLGKETILLAPRSSELSEVVVRPVAVKSKGDTITYNVDAVRNIGDRSIEDVISHLPGIEVSNGTISYNGEPINRFYIEGLDALGGNYATASQNIRAEDVAVIDLYENHEAKRVLKDRSLSKNAAINIKLKKRSMLRPAGYLTSGSGKSGDNPAWLGKAFGMLVAPASQLYFDGGGNNFGISTGSGGRYSSRTTLPMTGLLQLSTIGAVNVPSKLYTLTRAAGTSSNFAFKQGKYSTLRATVGYGFLRMQSDGSSITVYPLADGIEERKIIQSGSNNRRQQSMSLNLSYEYNAPGLYLLDELNAGASFSRGNADIISNEGNNVNQKLDNNDFVVNNHLNIVSRSDSRIWEGNINLDFHNAPLNSLLAWSADTGRSIVNQSVRSLAFNLNAGTRLGWMIGNSSDLGLSLKISNNYTKINTLGYYGEANEILGVNIPRGSESVVSIGPAYNLNKRYVRLQLGLPFEFVYQSFKLSPDRENYSHASVYFAPYASLRFFLPREVKGNMKLSFSRSRSGIENFVSNPIATSYRSIYSLGTGDPFFSSVWNIGTDWSWRKIVAGFFTSVSFNYVWVENSRLLSTDINDTEISTAYLDCKNRNDRFKSNLSVSKLMMGQKSTLKLDLSYSFMSGKTLRNEKILTMKNSDITAALSFNAPLFANHLVVKPSLMVSSAYQSSGTDFSQKYVTWQAVFPMTGLLFKGFDITVVPDFRSNPLAGSRRLNVFILGANARYRLRHLEFELYLENVTNRRYYAVESYSNMIYMSNGVKMSGIKALATVRYNF